MKPEIFDKKDQIPASHQIGVGWRLKNVSAFVSPNKADWIVIIRNSEKLSSVHGSSASM